MICEDVQRSLVFYLDEEIETDERRLIEKHLARCKACCNEIEALAATRRSATRTLKELGDGAQLSAQAWSHLQSRLVVEPRPRQAVVRERFAHLVPGDIRPQPHIFTGDNSMLKRFLIPAFATIVALLMLAGLMLRNVTPVSAQQILQRASKAQASVKSGLGIQHIRLEVYTNVAAVQGDQTGTHTIEDSYLDLGNDNVRRVTLDPVSGKVLDAFAYDGAYTYSTNQPLKAGSSAPLTIYRSPQSANLIAAVSHNSISNDAEKLFDEARNNPNVELTGKETWTDGRTVYVVRTQGPVKTYVDQQTKILTGATTIVFDAHTYQIIESQTTVQKDGQDILTSSYRYRVNEILPAGSPVPWDLSDLKGVRILGDASGEQGSLQPEVISPADLAVRAPGSYILNTTPEGFDVQISASPQQKKGVPFAYVASYRNAKDDYFVIQSAPQGGVVMPGKTGEIYITTSGLVLEFTAPLQAPNGKKILSATFKAPDGGGYLLNSTLPVARVKELAEGLVPVK